MTTTTAATGLYCTRCGSGGAELLQRTIDPRYPLVACWVCKHRGAGVTDRRAATADAQTYARKVHPGHIARGAAKDWCLLCLAEVNDDDGL